MFKFPEMSDLDNADLYLSEVYNEKSVVTFLYWGERYKQTTWAKDANYSDYHGATKFTQNFTLRV